MSRISDEDKSLFAAAIEGTKKIKQQVKVNHYRPKVSPRVKNNKMDNDHSLETIDVDQIVSAHESLLFQRKGVRLQEIQKLKKGQYPIEWQQDLHGYTEEEADRQLIDFIQSAIQTGIRSLLVVHGKGYNSDIERPVLKNLVNSRLRQMQDVLAFCSAQQKDGGVGAVYVLLKRP